MNGTEERNGLEFPVGQCAVYNEGGDYHVVRVLEDSSFDGVNEKYKLRVERVLIGCQDDEGDVFEVSRPVSGGMQGWYMRRLGDRSLDNYLGPLEIEMAEIRRDFGSDSN